MCAANAGRKPNPKLAFSSYYDRLWVRDGTIVFWCFEVLDSLLGYDDEFKLQYATGESYLNWEKAGFDPETWQK